MKITEPQNIGTAWHVHVSNGAVAYSVAFTGPAAEAAAAQYHRLLQAAAEGGVKVSLQDSAWCVGMPPGSPGCPRTT